MSEPTCDYPPCDEPAIGARGLIAHPEPIMLNVCAKHAAIMDKNVGRPDTEDFWRWFNAMSGMEG